MKLQNKFSIVIIPMVLLSTLTVGAFVYSYVSNFVANSIHQDTFNNIEIMSKTLDEKASQGLKSTVFISQFQEVKRYLTTSGYEKNKESQSDLIKLLAHNGKSNKVTQEHFIFDDRANLQFVYSGDIFYEPSSDLKWLRDISSEPSDEPFIKVVDTTQGYRFAYVTRVLDDKGNFIGYYIKTEEISSLIPWPDLNGLTSIVGAFAYHQGKVIKSHGNIDNSTVEQIMTNRRLDSDQVSIVNDDYLSDSNSVAYLKNSDLNIKFGVISDKNAITTAQKYIAVVVFLTSVITAIILCLTIYSMLKRMVVGRLNKLKETSFQIANGNYDCKLPEGSKDEIGDLYNAVNNMSNEIKSSNEKIHKMAYFDELTGLANKPSLHKTLDLMLKDSANESVSQSEIALLMIDLDDFKNINDVFGHQKGDLFLASIAKRIEKAVFDTASLFHNKSETCVSRLAGDEFAVIVKGKNVAKLSKAIATRIIDKVSDELKLDEAKFFPTCSIGISLFPLSAADGTELFKQSDIAMYEAKRDGKARFKFFEKTMMESLARKEMICKEIKVAMEHDMFDLYLQPKLNISTQRFNKFEVLLRWLHPVEGFISPSEFIPIAEESNLIVEIGTWVMNHTCKIIKRLENEGWEDFKISFNVSAQQMKDKNFVLMLQKNIDMFKIDSNHLEIEVTEHAMVADTDFIVTELNKVREMGVSIALDDFGTGYSSLAFIQKLPIDVIKLDRSFVSKAFSCEINLAIIKSVLSISEALKLETVAEGVEEEGEYELMKELGCDYIQGFYFHKPMPLTDILQHDFFNHEEKIAV